MKNNIEIVVIAYKRLFYLKQLFHTLLKCNGIEKYRINIHIDHGDNDDVIEYCRKIDFDNKNIVINKETLGCFKNRNVSLLPLLKDGKSVIYLEDDLVLAPDFLQWMEYFNEKFRNSPDIYSASGFSNHLFDIDLYDYYSFRPYFVVWGCINFPQMYNLIDNINIRDIDICRKIIELNAKEPYPLCSRVRNIGFLEPTHPASARYFIECYYTDSFCPLDKEVKEMKELKHGVAICGYYNSDYNSILEYDTFINEIKNDNNEFVAVLRDDNKYKIKKINNKYGKYINSKNLSFLFHHIDEEDSCVTRYINNAVYNSISDYLIICNKPLEHYRKIKQIFDNINRDVVYLNKISSGYIVATPRVIFKKMNGLKECEHFASNLDGALVDYVVRCKKSGYIVNSIISEDEELCNCINKNYGVII